MALSPAFPMREKILVFGPPKAGKTTAHLSIAKLAAKTGSDARFFIIDTDDAMGRMLSSEKWADVRERVVLMPTYEWSDYIEASKRVMAEAGPNDWCIIDMVDKSYKEAQTFYLEEIQGESIDEYLLRKKQELKKAGQSGKKFALKLYEEIDWQVVGSQYDAFLKPLLLKGRFHLFMVTEQKDVDDRTDAKQIRQMFSRFGVKPTGHKSLPYQVHTILHLDSRAKGRVITTIGDREREELSDVTYADFTMTYLVKTAGWSLR